MHMNNSNDWMQDEEIKKIDPKKLNFMMGVVKECEEKSPKQMMPYIMSASKRSKELGLQLTTQEAAVMMRLIQNYSTPEEQAKIDKILGSVPK